MARLIYADKRIQEIKKIYCTGCDNYGGAKCRACWVDDAMCLIDDAPTVDAVEVVRCLECKYRFKNNGHDKSGCPIIDANIWMDDDDFCSHGEREEGTE